MDWHRKYTRALLVCATTFCFSVGGSTLSLDPVIWNDSVSFIQSATESISSGSIVALNGVGAGYVVLLASVLYAGAGLTTVVFFQHCAWAFASAFCGYTLARVCRTYWALLPAIFIATYPGIQIYSNILMADSMYTVALTSALCSLLMAFGEKSNSLLLLKLLTAMLFASLAAISKAQGIAPLLVLGLASVWMSAPLPRRLTTLNFAVVVLAILTALTVRSNSVRSTDQTAVLFGSKTLFCFHLDLILSAPTTAPMAASAFGLSSNRLMEAFRSDFAVKSNHFPTLGYNADVCQYDKIADEIAISTHQSGVQGVAAWYQDAFVAAIVQSPHRYVSKLFSQIAYALKMSIPPHGLGSTLTAVSDRESTSRQLLAQYGLSQSGIMVTKSNTVAAPLISKLDSRALVVIFRVLSIAAAFALLCGILLMLSARWRRQKLAPSAAIAGLVWFSQIGAVAMTHTLDVWRYIVPVVPACVMACALLAAIVRMDLKSKTPTTNHFDCTVPIKSKVPTRC